MKELFELTPIDGMKVNFSNNALAYLDTKSDQIGLLDYEQSDKVKFLSNLGLLKIKDSEYMIYRVENNQFIVPSCKGEILHIASRLK